MLYVNPGDLVQFSFTGVHNIQEVNPAWPGKWQQRQGADAGTQGPYMHASLAQPSISSPSLTTTAHCRLW